LTALLFILLVYVSQRVVSPKASYRTD